MLRGEAGTTVGMPAFPPLSGRLKCADVRWGTMIDGTEPSASPERAVHCRGTRVLPAIATRARPANAWLNSAAIFWWG